jgi:hypothetical protein
MHDEIDQFEFAYCFKPTDTEAHQGQLVRDIILTPANQWMQWGLKYGHCPIRVFNQGVTFVGFW